MMLFLESELRSSAYFSMATVSRTVMVRGTVNRDGLCFVSVKDWSRADAYNRLEGRPNWDKYLLYYATQELPSGRLIRLDLTPQDALDVGSFPYPLFLADRDRYMTETPLSFGGDDLSSVRTLATKVKSFKVRLLPTTKEVEVRTVLRQNGIMSRRGDSNREGGTFELNYRVHPQNTK